MPGPTPKQNHLLAALSAADLKRLRAHLEPVDMPLGHVLYESGHLLDHVYFPTAAIVSLLYVMENGASAEIAVVGNEGVVGIALFMGGETTPSRAVVQSAGQGYRLSSQVHAAGVQPRWSDAAPAAALYPGAHHADGADRRVQPAPLGRAATLPLAAPQPRPLARRRG